MGNIKYKITKDEFNQIQCFIEKKTLFGKIKRKQIPAEVFFNDIACLSIMPEISNISLYEFLYTKYIYNRINRISDFNGPVKVDMTYYNEEKIEESNNRTPKYSYECEANIYNSNLQLVLKIKAKEIIRPVRFKPSKDLLKNLITLAFNGVYGSAREEDSIIRILKPDKILWECATCKEKFNTIDEFYSHIIETKHADLIFLEFPYDKELQNIRKLIENDD